MGSVVYVAFRPAPPSQAEVARAADISILTQIELWAKTKQHLTERGGRPLNPRDRARALEALSAIRDQPRNE